MNSGKQIFCNGLTELEQKWKSHWAQEDLEVSQKGDGHVLGVNLSEGCRSAAIYNDGKFLTVRWQGDLPNDLLSPDCSQELRNAFFMRALKKEAEAALDTRVSEIVVAADGARSLMNVQSYRKSATIAGVHCCRILSDVSLAQFVATSPEDSGEDDVVAIISVDKTCVGVSICSFLCPGDYGILSKRGLRLANQLKPLSEIERLYRECRDAVEKRVTKVFICGNSECVSSVMGALHEITGLEVQILDDSETVAARGAAFEGAIFKDAVKDAVMSDTCGAALGVELADGSMEELIGQDVQIPTFCSVMVTPMGAETEGLSVNVFEGNHEIAAKNTFIGSLRLPPGVGDCEVEIATDVNKYITVTARRISDGTEVKKTMSELGTERLKNGLFRICGTDLPTAVSEKTCDHCHGEGKHTCGECHGKGSVACSECHGEKEVKCSKCNGHGHFSNCHTCNSTGKETCSKCGGSGRIREKCPTCGGSGRIQKKRKDVCGECHGSGQVWYGGVGADGRRVKHSCPSCGGSGYLSVYCKETCPYCGGDGRSPHEVTCGRCKGRGEYTCSRCHGTGHAECSECSGTGKVTCGECNGKGEVACHDCHGAGDHVCVECYGTGDKLSDIALKNYDGSEKVAEGVRLVKEKKYVEAFELFREAAVKDHNAEALRRLGARYMNGNAVYQNFKRANLLYRAAANAGDIRALFILGCNYLEGKGVETKDSKNTNRSEARRLLEIATKKGCEDAEPEYLKVATSKLVKNALSGVVGWRGEFEIPQFLLDADPAAEQKDKDEKEAARKAEEARKERERKRKIRNIHLCRGLWWFLFRVAAAGTFFTCFKDSYKNVPDETVKLFAAWFFVTSYLIRPRFGGVGYFFIGLAAAIVPLFINSTNPMVSFCVFTVMVTFFMRWMGEKLKFPLLTYPLVGAMVGFCTSPFSISHNVFNVTPWWFSSLGLAILFFLVNMGMSGNNENGVVAKGARKTSWTGTFCLLALCGLVSWYIFASATGEQYKFKWQSEEEKQAVKPEERKLSMYEQGVRFRDGAGVSKNMEMAKKMFGAVITSNANEQDVGNAEIALGRMLIDEGKADEALKHLKSAAARGSAEAYFLLGEMLQKSGKMESAIKLYQTAADRGFVGAMMVLGQYYSEKTGFLGGRRDKDLAVKYYTMAADRGNAEAKEKMKEL